VNRTADKFFQIVDYVGWYEFSGGEPLLHNQLPDMVEHVIKYSSQFEKLLIITNGTLMPTETLEKVLIQHRNKMLIQISHYGAVSIKADEFAKRLKDNNVDVQIKKYFGNDQHFGGWVDYGDFKLKNRSESQLQSIFSRCGATKMNGNMTTHNGKIHWCVPSARLMTVLGHIPDADSEYIDLFDDTLSVQEQRKKIENLYSKKYISACNYCSGDFGSETAKRYPAGEQI
jgi:hypothetical protein